MYKENKIPSKPIIWKNPIRFMLKSGETFWPHTGAKAVKWHGVCICRQLRWLTVTWWSASGKSFNFYQHQENGSQSLQWPLKIHLQCRKRTPTPCSIIPYAIGQLPSLPVTLLTRGLVWRPPDSSVHFVFIRERLIENMPTSQTCVRKSRSHILKNAMEIAKYHLLTAY
jgi:hypothetical protein